MDNIYPYIIIAMLLIILVLIVDIVIMNTEIDDLEREIKEIRDTYWRKF